MDTTAERLIEQPAEPPEPPARSAWELIDEDWDEREGAPMCM